MDRLLGRAAAKTRGTRSLYRPAAGGEKEAA
jgi:hypothetical protein